MPQSTAKEVRADDSRIVPLMSGQGFSARPVVPDVTGAEDAVAVAVEESDVVVIELQVK